MSFSVEEDHFCNVYCDMVNGDWEASMQQALGDSEAELREARSQCHSLERSRSWLVKKMQEVSAGSDQYNSLQFKLGKVKKALAKRTVEFYREKHRHTAFVKKYREESRKKLGEARASFSNMTMNQRVLLARQLMDRGVAVAACERYLAAAGEHAASYGMAMDQVQETADLALHRATERDIAARQWHEQKPKPHCRKTGKQRSSYQRAGYAEGRKIDIN